ncbi:MAG: BON domain-containing protein, partial [Thermoanaerobaculia bacterium]
SILQNRVPQAFPTGHADIRIKSLRGDVTLVGHVNQISELRLESAIVQIQHLPYVREVGNNVIIRPNEE